MINKKVLLDPDHKPAQPSAQTIWSLDNCKVSKEPKKAKKAVGTKRKHVSVNMTVNVLTEKPKNPNEKIACVNNIVPSNLLPTIIEVEEDVETIVEDDLELDAQVENPNLDQKLEEREHDVPQEELGEESKVQQKDDSPAEDLEEYITKKEDDSPVNDPEEDEIQEEDDFPADDLENEEVAKVLFNLSDFYPKDNIVEAYLKSKNGEDNQDDGQIIRLWDKILKMIYSRKESLSLSMQEGENLNKEIEQMNQLVKDISIGLDTPREIEVSLSEKVIRIIPELIAEIEKVLILVFMTEGCTLATGYGTQIHSTRVIPIYQSKNSKKIYEYFGLRFFRDNQSIPRKLAQKMTYAALGKESNSKPGLLKGSPGNVLSVNAWGKTTVMDLLKKFNMDSPLDEEILKHMSELEKGKQTERAAEWIQGIPLATKRNLYKMQRGDVLPRSAYQGNHQQGLRAVEMKGFDKRVYVNNRKRENHSIETDMLVYDYNRVPMEELESTGLFENAGPLLAIARGIRPL